MTFTVHQDGVVHEARLGRDMAKLATAIDAYASGRPLLPRRLSLS